MKQKSGPGKVPAERVSTSSIRRRAASSRTSSKTSMKPPLSISSTRSAQANPSRRRSAGAARTWSI
jgi:hypothetical protein